MSHRPNRRRCGNVAWLKAAVFTVSNQYVNGSNAVVECKIRDQVVMVWTPSSVRKTFGHDWLKNDWLDRKVLTPTNKNEFQ